MATPSRAPIVDAIGSVSSDDWLAFLRKQRWFAAKGASPANARTAGIVVLPWGSDAYAIARLAVDVGDKTATYQVPLALTRDTSTVPDQSIVRRNADGTTLLDAVQDTGFRTGLIDALSLGATAEGADGLRWIAEPTDASPPPDTTSRVGSAEQSNTSMIVGEQAILKLFRTLQPGVQPDVEVTRFLTTRAGFENAPRLLATMTLEQGGAATTAGMMQQYLPGSTDAWSYVLERSASYFSAPARTEPANDFLRDAKRLGEVTRGMHDALASSDDEPDFAPEHVDGDDLDRWAHRTQQSVRDSLALLERQIATLPKERLGEAQALVQRRDHYVGWVNEICDALGDDLGLRTRTHGDYHLGQVLRTRDGDFMVIDFEGEPSRSLDERREKTSPLRDVAGMLRSFAYAAATLAMNAKNADAATRELRAARWERDVRAAYLAGYLAGDPDESGALPEDEEHVRQLITLFETEKAFYELAYELNNRPAWAWIPMRGISKLFTKAR